MTKKHYIQIAVCSLLIVICGMLFYGYYRDYIAPESYVIGKTEELSYKSLMIADYISEGDVIFSQNINDKSFAKDEDISVYEYNFDAKDFDGVENNYLIFVNDYMLTDITSNAGTISGKYLMNYYDVNKNVLCSSTITIDFSFYSLASSLKVSVNTDELGYLMNYFKTDNFIVTLSKNAFAFEDNLKTEEDSQYCTVTYMVNDEVYGTQLYTKGQKINLIDIENENYNVWTLNDEVILNNFIVETDLILTASFKESTWTTLYASSSTEIIDEEFTQSGNVSVLVDGLRPDDVIRVTFSKLCVYTALGMSAQAVSGNTYKYYSLNSDNQVVWDYSIDNAADIVVENNNEITIVYVDGVYGYDDSIITLSIKCDNANYLEVSYNVDGVAKLSYLMLEKVEVYRI